MHMIAGLIVSVAIFVYLILQLVNTQHLWVGKRTDMQTHTYFQAV